MASIRNHRGLPILEIGGNSKAAFPPSSRAVLLSLLAVTCVYGQWSVPLPLQIKPSGSYLGLGLRDIDADRAKELKLIEAAGVEIVAVEEGGAGDQAGIRPGDVILSYNGEQILGAQQLIRLVSETPQGRHIRAVCWRGGEKKELILITGGSHNSTVDQQQDLVVRGRVTEVPYPVMIWRNLILGIDSESLGEQLAEAAGVKQGILIWAVSDGSPAKRAGLRAGDVVTSFCGRPIQSPREVGMALQEVQGVGKSLTLGVVRDHKPLSLAILLEGSR